MGSYNDSIREDTEKTVQFDINKIVKDDITELDIFPRVNSNTLYNY